MRIVDMNIFSKFCAGEIEMDFSGPVYITKELKDEIEIHKVSFPDHHTKLQRVKFVDIEMYQYHGGKYFDEAKYLFHYKRLINKYTKITSFYGMKGFGDMSILSSVATVLDPENSSLFDPLVVIEVLTHDNGLKKALIQEFGNKVTIIDPVNI